MHIIEKVFGKLEKIVLAESNMAVVPDKKTIDAIKYSALAEFKRCAKKYNHLTEKDYKFKKPDEFVSWLNSNLKYNYYSFKDKTSQEGNFYIGIKEINENGKKSHKIYLGQLAENGFKGHFMTQKINPLTAYETLQSLLITKLFFCYKCRLYIGSDDELKSILEKSNEQHTIFKNISAAANTSVRRKRTSSSNCFDTTGHGW